MSAFQGGRGNISLSSSAMHRTQNFEIVLKSDTTVLTFTFHFLSSPPFSLFILVGKRFRKAYRTLEFDEGKVGG